MLELTIFTYGSIASALSIYLGFTFYRIKHLTLSRPLAFIVWGGAVAGMTTLAFSFSSLIGAYHHFSDWSLAGMRSLIFTGISAADVYMFYTIKKIKCSRK